MAITINGAGTITGISVGGLPDGSVTDADLASSLNFSSKTVTGLPAGGKVLQYKVQYVSVLTGLSGNQSTYADSGVEATFTPTDATSLVVINLALITHCHQSSSLSHSSHSYRLMRDKGDGNGFTYVTAFNNHTLIRAYTNSGTAQWGGPTFFVHRDSPATTNQVTYKIQYKNDGSAGYLQWDTTKKHVWNFWEIAA